MSQYEWLVFLGIGLYIAFSVHDLRKQVAELRKQIADLTEKPK